MIVKKGISISLALLIIAAMFHFSVATHYCGGHIAASKVSMTGKLAGCGMEDSRMELPSPGLFFSKHCCEDELSTYSIENNYIPSFFSIPDSEQFNFLTSGLPSGQIVSLSIVFKPQYMYESPPGAVMSTNVDLSDICVFRI